jgi:hypothetical protein
MPNDFEGYVQCYKKYPQNLPGEESEQIESYEETVAKDDFPNESMKTFGKKTNT